MCIHTHTHAMYVSIHYICIHIYYKHISSYPKLTDKETGLLRVRKSSPSQLNSTALAIRFLVVPSLRTMCLLSTVLDGAGVHCSCRESMWIQELQLLRWACSLQLTVFFFRTQGCSHVDRPPHWSLVGGATETDRLEGPSHSPGLLAFRPHLSEARRQSLKCFMSASGGHGSPYTFIFSAGCCGHGVYNLQVLVAFANGEGTVFTHIL